MVQYKENEHKDEEFWYTNNQYRLKTFHKRHEDSQKISLKYVIGFKM